MNKGNEAAEQFAREQADRIDRARSYVGQEAQDEAARHVRLAEAERLRPALPAIISPRPQLALDIVKAHSEFLALMQRFA
jgi:hypothetical protein